MRNKLSGQKGFTLVEVMISAAIFSVLIMGLYVALEATSDQSDVSQAKMTLQESGTRALYKMEQELRLSASDRVVVAADGNSVTFDVPDPDNPFDSNYNTNWTDSHSVTYSLSGTQLMRADSDAGTSSVLANDVTDIEFAGNDTEPTVVTITIDLQKTLSNGRVIPDDPLVVMTQAEVRNA